MDALTMGGTVMAGVKTPLFTLTVTMYSTSAVDVEETSRSIATGQGWRFLP